MKPKSIYGVSRIREEEQSNPTILGSGYDVYRNSVQKATPVITPIRTPNNNAIESEETPYKKEYAERTKSILENVKQKRYEATLPTRTAPPTYDPLDIKRRRQALATGSVNPIGETLIEYAPGTGDALQLGGAIKDAKVGNYTAAALGAGLLVLPDVLAKPLKKVANKFIPSLKNVAKTVNLEASYIPIKVKPGAAQKAQYNLDAANEWQRNWYNSPERQKVLNKRIRESDNELIDAILSEGPSAAIGKRLNDGFYNARLSDAYLNSESILSSMNRWNMVAKNISEGKYTSAFETKENKLYNLLKGKQPLHYGNFGISGEDIDIGIKESGRNNIVRKWFKEPEKTRSVAVHEGNHGITEGDRYLDKAIEKDIMSIFEDTNLPVRVDGKHKSYSDYLREPTEVYARIAQLRLENNLDPGEIITEDRVTEMLDKVINGKSQVNKEFGLLVKNKLNFAKLFNKLPLAAGAALTGDAIVQSNKKQVE